MLCRLCVTQNTKIKGAFFEPAGYNRSDFVLLQRYLQSCIDSKKFVNGPSFRDIYSLGGKLNNPFLKNITKVIIL